MAHEDRRRRRIDHLTAQDYLDGLEGRDLVEVRTMRDDCREEEAHLSYTRRLLQGRLDIARAELARRRGDSQASIIDQLPQILADVPSNRRRDVRATPMYTPEHGGRRREDTVIDDSSLGGILDLDDDGLAVYLARVAEDERTVSERRRTLLDHIDALQSELVRRLQAGDVGLDEIVSLSVPAGDGEEPRG